MKKPNIVFFFTDDQRFDTIAALNNPAIHTPHIDALVKRGTAFTRAHIPCGTSGAVCMPSRAMLNTGRTLFHITDAGRSIAPEHTTIGEALRQNGYRTFGTGKWHNGTESFNRSFDDGNEIFFGGMADHWNVPAYHYDPSGAYDTVLPCCPDPFHTNTVSDRRADHIRNGVHSSELVCAAAVDWIHHYNDPAPFYTYISFLAPHDPRTMPSRFLEMYDPADIPLPPNFRGGHPFDTGVLHIRDEELAPFPREEDDTRRHLAEYYAMISHLDDELGKVVRAVEEKGELDNTLFIFAGDNGLALGQHGLFGKQNCYEHSVRVPLIFAGPGVPAGVRSDSLCYLFDVFPTICGLAGLETPASVEGQNLTPAMETPGSPLRDSLYFAYCQYQRAVKKDGYKLIEYVVKNKRRKTQLFHLDSDPYELTNLADESPDRVREMRALLREYAHAWDDESSTWGREFWSGFDAPPESS